MARLIPLCILILFFSCREAPQSLRTGEDHLREIYVIHSLSERVGVFQAGSAHRSMETFQTGSVPNSIHYYQDQLYVVNSMDNSLSIVDESLLLPLGEIYLGINRNPWMILSSGQDSRALVPQFLAGSAAWINLEAASVEGEVSLGLAPEGGAVLGELFFVCCTGYNAGNFDMGELWVLDGPSGEVLSVISCGPASNPQSAAAIEEKNEIHVYLTGINGGPGSNDGEILVIDAISLEVKSRHFIGGSPVYSGMAKDSGRQRIYLSGTGGVMCYNYQTMEILNGSDNYLYPPPGQGGTLISSVLFDQQDDLLYLTDFSGDFMVLLQGQNGEFLDRWEVDDGPIYALLVEE